MTSTLIAALPSGSHSVAAADLTGCRNTNFGTFLVDHVLRTILDLQIAIRVHDTGSGEYGSCIAI
jgi:hypothetical protein